MDYEEVTRLCKKHGKKTEDFDRFINGQTVGIIGGKIDYYEWDVARFIGRSLTTGATGTR